jgi:hypothetical protein
MVRGLGFLLLFLPLALLQTQDDVARTEADHLLSVAQRASLPANPPNYEQDVMFRMLDPSSDSQTGTIQRIVVNGVGRRDEFAYGAFHTVNVWTSKGLASTRNGPRPKEIDLALRLVPIELFHLNGEDVVHSVTAQERDGRTMRCIDFETIAGLKHDANELCTDSQNGTLVSATLGREQIQNSEFFQFAGALIPGKIVYTFAGVPKIEISQTMTPTAESPQEILTPPSNAVEHAACATSREPIAESAPMPPRGVGSGRADSVVEGWILVTGKVYNPMIIQSDRPDLDDEALAIFSQWKFTPMMCDGKPNPARRRFTIHFTGR